MLRPVPDRSHLSPFLEIPDKFLCQVTVLVGFQDFIRFVINTGLEDEKSLETGHVGVRDFPERFLDMSPGNDPAFRIYILAEVFTLFHVL